MDKSFTAVRVVIAGLGVAILVVGLSGGSLRVMGALLTVFLFSASFMDFYAYVNPSRVAAAYCCFAPTRGNLTG